MKHFRFRIFTSGFLIFLAFFSISSLIDPTKVILEGEEEFDEVVASTNLEEEDWQPPPPTPPAAPTTCTGDQTYDINLQGTFLTLFGEGVQIEKVIVGRGSKDVDYWDASYGTEGDEIFHKPGDKVRIGCKPGYMNNLAKQFTGAECTCTDTGCTFVKALADWGCVSEAEQQMPVWTGAKFNFIKAVQNEYVVLKTRVSNYINAENWDFDQLDLETYPGRLNN